MKKIFTNLFLFLLLFTATNTSAQVKIGVTLASNKSMVKTDLFNEGKPYVTLMYGITSQISLGKNFMFCPSLNIATSGVVNVQTTTIPLGTNITLVSDYSRIIANKNLQIPLEIAYDIKTKKGKVIIGLAPVFTLGLKSTFTETQTINITGQNKRDTSLSKPLYFNGANPTFKRVEWGARFGLGYQFKSGLQLYASYKKGLNDIAVGTAKHTSNEFSIALSYFFINNL
jgi:Outer membrane protein beta-barrel domain